MKFLSTEEGRVAGLAGVNILMASAQPWAVHTAEVILRITLLVGQIAVAYITAMYVYKKLRSTKTDDKD